MIPFDEQAITILMGVPSEDPMRPGMHGSLEQGPCEGMGDDKAKEVLMQIKKLVCEYFESEEPAEQEECDEL